MKNKIDTISRWKRRGVIYGDFEELYYTYIRTLNCSHCNKEFNSSRDRHLDHNHITGLFRAIVCQKCNCNDSYIKYPNGYDRKIYRELNKEYETKYRETYRENNKEKIKEYRQANTEKQKEYRDNHKEANKEKHKEYRDNHKEKTKEYNKEYREANKEKITKKYYCDCGGKYIHENKKQHLKTIKHTAWFMEQVD